MWVRIIASMFLGAGLSQIGMMVAIAAEQNKWWGFIAGLITALGLVIYLGV